MFDLGSPPVPALQQSGTWRRTLARVGAGVGETGGFVSLHRRIAGIPVTMIPRFHASDPAALVGALPGGVSILSPEAPCPDLQALGAVRIARPVQVASLALDTDAEVMRRAMHQKWRNRLRHGEGQRLKLRAGRMPPDPNHWLLAADRKQARGRGYRGWPAALTVAWAQVAPASTLYLEARDSKGPVAALLFLLHGPGATYHVGHTTDRGRARSAHNLLMWSAMQRLAQEGITHLDLGQLHDRTPGLNRFKLGCGARAQSLGGTWLWWRPLATVRARTRTMWRTADLEAIND